MPATTSIASHSDPHVSGIFGSTQWATNSLTFSFPTSSSFYGSSYGSAENTTGFAPLNSAQHAAARSAFDQYASIANLTFTEITESSARHADLRLAMSDKPSTAWAYYPSTAAEGGDAWFNRASGSYNNPANGNYAYLTFLHEIGHALGLDHSHEGRVMPGYDSMEYTVMSYRSFIGSTDSGYTNENWGYAQTLMMYDIAAIQHMYGANFATNAGDTVYSWSATTGQMSINAVGQVAAGGNRIFQTVWDGGGIDTYDFSNYQTNLSIDLRPGYWTTTHSAQLARLHYNGSQIADGNIGNSFQYNGDARSLIENAVGGSGNDLIVGNAANNVLRGNGGNDKIDGGAGVDTAVFSGRFADYSISWLSATTAQVQDGRLTDGTDLVSGVEYFTFSDRTIVAAQSVITEHFTAAGSWTGADGGDKGWMSGDFNGDGRDDIFRYLSGFSGADVHLSNGSTFVRSGSWTGSDNGYAGWYVGDFNGDGRDDLFRYMPGSSGADVQLSNGSGFVSVGSWTGATLGDRGWHIGDFNGDGRDDIFRYLSGVSGADVHLSNGSVFIADGSWTGRDGGQSGWTVGDFNGDGRDDLVRSSGGTGAEVFLSDGDQFVFAGQWSSMHFAAKPKAADFNGDGLDDLFIPGANGAPSALLLSNGNAFETRQFDFNLAYGHVIGDFNGDNSYDISRYLPGVSGGDMWLA